MSGRFKAHSDQPFVVFLIGMRINRALEVSKWLPTAMAMGPMLRSLHQHPEKGFLAAEPFLYWRGIGLVQYWRSLADLEQFARSPSDPHIAAWQRFNRALGSEGSVGIWHETYQVQPGNYESIYVNMPVFGLGAATTHVPATPHRQTAQAHLHPVDS
ncbi:MAG TPA: DUF4188 domain-containing protein [Chroococcidiopsis sp.]